jgi:hypothetical protein
MQTKGVMNGGKRTGQEKGREKTQEKEIAFALCFRASARNMFKGARGVRLKPPFFNR